MHLLILEFLLKRGSGYRYGRSSRYYAPENHAAPTDWESFCLYLLFCLLFLAITVLIANISTSGFPKNPLKWHLHVFSFFKIKTEDSSQTLWWFAAITFFISILCLFQALLKLVALLN